MTIFMLDLQNKYQSKTIGSVLVAVVATLRTRS
jgi:hypothetical protein